MLVFAFGQLCQGRPVHDKYQITHELGTKNRAFFIILSSSYGAHFAIE